MTSEQFVYWLQGYFEISKDKTLDESQIQIIKDHLSLVFNKVTPIYTKEPITGFLPTVKFVSNVSCSGPLEFNDPPKIGFMPS